MCFTAHRFKNCIYVALLNSGVDFERVVTFSKTINKCGSDDLENEETVKEEVRITNEILLVMESNKFTKNLHEEFKKCVEMHLHMKSFCQLVESFFSPVLLPIILLAINFLIFLAYSLIMVRTCLKYFRNF